MGVKVQKLTGKGAVEYPKETPWFVVPAEVEAVYGAQPTELDVMLPHEDPEVFFPQKLAMYGSGTGLQCHGDNQKAKRLNAAGQWEDRTCPCEHLKSAENPRGACTEQSSLMVLLPKVSMGGCYQITTGSFHSTVTVNSALDYIRALAGRLALIPLKLRRVPRETHNDGKKQTHYTLELILDGDLRMIRELRADTDGIFIPARYSIEGPVDENKTLDPPDEVETHAEDLAEADDAELAGIQEALKKQAEVKGTLGVKTPPKTEKSEPTPGKEKLELTPPPTTPPPAPAQMALEEPVQHKYERFGTGLIPPHKWSELIQYIDTNPDLACLKEDWKADRKVDNVLRMTVGGQQNLLGFFRDTVKEFPY